MPPGTEHNEDQPSLSSILLVSRGGGKIRRLAEEYGGNVNRFVSKSVAEARKCILFGLCVRYCSEVVVVNMDAIGVVGRGTDRQIVAFPEISKDCLSCKKCFHVCPTGKNRGRGKGKYFPRFLYL